MVVEQLPSAMYRVRLDDGPQVLAHVADRIDRNFIQVLDGYRLSVELSTLNAGRGRIVGKRGRRLTLGRDDVEQPGGTLGFR